MLSAAPKDTLLDIKTGLQDLTEGLDCCRVTTMQYEDGDANKEEVKEL